jgi:hypothetical protein
MSPIQTLTTVDLEDYESIKKHLPLTTPKQVKWIKQMFAIARSLGDQEPIAEKYLELCDKLKRNSIPPEITHQLQMQMLAGIKSSMASRKRELLKKYEPKAQMSLFHPEAFENL